MCLVSENRTRPRSGSNRKTLCLCNEVGLGYPAFALESFLCSGGVAMCGETADSVDDAQLMARLAAGDRTALGTLIQRHQRRVLELAYRTTGDHALAEDIGQEAFLRVWRSVKRYRPTAQFTTWLYRIVVNLCLDAFKRRKAVTGEVPDAADNWAAGQATAIEERERATAVQHAVAALPDRQRVAVVLHRFSGLTVRTTAEATGWSESAVESLLVRAYEALRQSLKELEKK